MKPGLPASIALHVAVLGWALVSFASTPPMEAPASDPIDVELLPPSQTTQQKLGSKTGKPSDEIKKETAASPKATTGNRAGTTKSEEPPPPPPEQKPTPPAEKPQEAAAAPPVPEAKPEQPKPTPEPPKPQVAEVKPPPPPTPPPPQKPEPAKEPEKPLVPAEKPVEVKPPPKPTPPKDEKALEKLIEEAKKPEPKPVEKKPEAKPPAKAQPEKLAMNDPKAASTPTQKPSTLRGQQTDIVNRVETGTSAGRLQQHASLGNPTGPAANVKLSQSELEGLNNALMSQIKECWSIQNGWSESGVKVSIDFSLNQDGTLNGEPQAGTFIGASSEYLRPILNSAIRAIKMCAARHPFKLPADKYAYWQVNHITFDPKFPQ